MLQHIHDLNLLVHMVFYRPLCRLSADILLLLSPNFGNQCFISLYYDFSLPLGALTSLAP